MGKQIIYSNVFDGNKMQEAVDNLKEAGIENPSDGQITDNMIFKDKMSWDGFVCDMEAFMHNKTFVLFGTENRWNGPVSGFDIVESLDDIMDILKSCDEIEFSDHDGHFFVTGWHHDGKITMEMRELNDKGIMYYENWFRADPYADSRPESFIAKKLKTEKYSKLPHYCETMWGTMEDK